MAKDKPTSGKAAELDAVEPPERPVKIKAKIYLEEVSKLHLELSKLQEWVKAKGLKVVVVRGPGR